MRSLFNALPDFGTRKIQLLGELAPVVHAMLEVLSHFEGVRGTSFYTQIAHSAKLKMVNKCIDRFLLFSVRANIEFGDDLDGSIGAGKFTGCAARAGMFIVFIMRHHYFTTKPLSQFQC